MTKIAMTHNYVFSPMFDCVPDKIYASFAALNIEFT